MDKKTNAYDNEVISEQIYDILTTAVDMNSYMTLDNDLAENAGMKKTVHTYHATGDAEDLSEGEGNTGEISVSYTSKEYEVGVTQGKYSYTDEAEMTDPKLVEAGIDGLAKTLINKITSKAIAEMEKATLSVDIDTSTGITFDNVVDALGKVGTDSYNTKGTEDETGYTLLINPAMKAKLRKNLKDDLSYSEGYVRTGYIGTVCGIPVVVSKAVVDDHAYLTHPAAITCFTKKTTQTEQKRDPDKRTTEIFSRFVNVIALTDASKIVIFKAAE